MPGPRSAACCALAVVLATATTASAQVRGFGFGFYPFYQYNGFYSNGFSQYGPPIPTYAPVPGMFGGSSQHSYAGPAWHIPRLPATPPGPDGPVMVPVRRATKPPAAPAEDAAPDQLPPPRKLNLDAAAQIDVRLSDESAAVSINGRETRQSGAARSFQTPALEAGQVFVYEVEARWRDSNGKLQRELRTVAVEAGKQFVVDFNQ